MILFLGFFHGLIKLSRTPRPSFFTVPSYKYTSTLKTVYWGWPILSIQPPDAWAPLGLLFMHGSIPPERSSDTPSSWFLFPWINNFVYDHSSTLMISKLI